MAIGEHLTNLQAIYIRDNCFLTNQKHQRDHGSALTWATYVVELYSFAARFDQSDNLVPLPAGTW
jgi:hypothetical protein